MDRQGCDHHPGSDIWPTHMAALLRGLVHQRHTDLGIEQKAIAYSGGIQYSMDMAKPYGLSAAPDLTAVLS